MITTSHRIHIMRRASFDATRWSHAGAGPASSHVGAPCQHRICSSGVARFTPEDRTRHGDRQPHARLLLRRRAHLRRRQRAWRRSTAAVAEGADIVDIGGVKAGPGEEVDVAEELRRTVDFVAAVRERHPDVVISVDTWRAEVGDAVCGPAPTCSTTPGAGTTPSWPRSPRRTASGSSAPTPAAPTPRTRPHRVEYDDVVAAVVDFLEREAARAEAAGVPPQRILIDPAHDFGKNTRHSLEVTRRLDELVATGWPVLVSLSNKDFVGETLDAPVGERLDRHAGGDRRQRLAGSPGLSGARGAGDASRCCRWCRRSRGHRPPAVARRGLA